MGRLKDKRDARRAAKAKAAAPVEIKVKEIKENSWDDIDVKKESTDLKVKGKTKKG